MKLFYDCTRSSKALRTGVHSLSLLYRLVKVGLSDEVRAQVLVLRLHCSFLCEQIPRHVGPFHCASYSFHYRGLSGPVESRFGSLGAQASQWANPYPLSVRRKTLVNQSIVPDSSSSCTTSLALCDGVLFVLSLCDFCYSCLHSPYSLLFRIRLFLCTLPMPSVVLMVPYPPASRLGREVAASLFLGLFLLIHDDSAPRECVPFVLILLLFFLSFSLFFLYAQSYMLR